MAIAGRKAQVKVSGEGVSFTDEPTTGNVGRTVYTITDATKATWDRTASITVENDDAGDDNFAASTGYTINRLKGQVTFGSALPSGTQVQVSGTYLPMSVAAEAKMYKYSINGKTQDDSAFGDSWRTFQPTIKSASGSISQWHTTDTYFSDALVAGAPVVLELWSNSSGALDARLWAILNNAQMQAVLDGLNEESVEFTSTTDADGRTISG